MNLFQESKKVLDKDGKVNALGPYGRQKLTGREMSTYFRRNKVKDAQIKKAVEVALDLGGAMSVAQREIKKFYGDKILNSPEVKQALKYANEEVVKEDTDLSEDYRKLAKYGMGTETSKSARVGLELDFYDSKGNKKFGKILQKTNTGYLVKDDKGKKHELKYLDRKKAQKMLKPNYVHTESINEVTDKEINMAKKLSKDMEKVKKGYQQIAKTGDKTLKNTGFNPTYESILKAQQKVLSLIGELTTMKQMSDRAASRKKDAQGRPIMSSNIMDSYRIMHEESMQDKLSKLFKMRDKKAIDGVANLLNMTSVKVLQSMQKQNPKGFERMAKKMGELPAMEGKDIIDEKLSREDLKLIDKMYDKKGNLTPIGKKVMEYGKKKKK